MRQKTHNFLAAKSFLTFAIVSCNSESIVMHNAPDPHSRGKGSQRTCGSSSAASQSGRVIAPVATLSRSKAQEEVFAIACGSQRSSKWVKLALESLHRGFSGDGLFSLLFVESNRVPNSTSKRQGLSLYPGAACTM